MKIRSTEDRAWLPVYDVAAAGTVRRTAVAVAAEAGMPEARVADLAIVATELATNLAKHANGGRVAIRLARCGEAIGVELVALDDGPGMGDVAASITDGYSTAGSLGIGLGAVVRLATEFGVYSQADPGGTTLVASVWTTPPEPARTAGLRRAITGESVCGDAYAAREVDGRLQIMLCDGLGHGPLAGRAADAAVAAFLDAPVASPRHTVAYMNDRLGHTRGVVAAVAELDGDAGVVRFAGVGNVTAVVADGVGGRRGMVSLPGILGHRPPAPREFEYALSPSAAVILHSDGLSDRWHLADFPGLWSHPPVVQAGTLLRAAGRRRDDASIVVATAS